MLRKLMKYELRAMGRVLLPIFAVVLCLSVGVNLSGRFLIESEQPFLTFLGISSVTLFGVGLAAMSIVCVLLIIKRFHSNFLTDEGYVMMTLPVSIHQLIWSKLLVSLCYGALMVVCLGLCVCIAVFDLQEVQGLYANLLSGFQAFIDAFASAEGLSILTLLLQWSLLCVLGTVSAILMAYTAMAIGHSFASHKIIFSVLLYMAIQWVMQLLSFLLMMVGSFLWNQPQVYSFAGDALDFGSAFVSISGWSWLSIAYSILTCALLYVITAYFLKRRLNLA